MDKNIENPDERAVHYSKEFAWMLSSASYLGAYSSSDGETWDEDADKYSDTSEQYKKMIISEIEAATSTDNPPMFSELSEELQNWVARMERWDNG